MSLLYYRGIQLQVCRFLNGCERTQVNDGRTRVTFNQFTWPN
jgi:hypothetical protein